MNRGRKNWHWIIMLFREQEMSQSITYLKMMIAQFDTHYVDHATIEGLLELGGEDDPGFVASLVQDYLTDTRQNIDAIRKSILEGDSTTLTHRAHSIKGASYNIGAMQVGDIAKSLEFKGRAGEMTNIELLLEQLEKVFNFTTIELAKLV